MTIRNKVIVITSLVMVVGVAYFYKTQVNRSDKTIPESAPVVAQPSSQEAVNNLVKNFYTALESRDGKLLFSYFTPPVTSEEIKDFTWLTGADLAGSPVYRAFFRQNISDPKVSSTQMVDVSTFVIKISDQIIGIPSAGSEDKVFNPQSRSVVLTIIKSGDKWLVDKFTDPTSTKGLNTSTPKYSGFGQ